MTRRIPSPGFKRECVHEAVIRLVSAVLLSASLLSANVQADVPSETSELSEIVVTAQRREQPILEVPMQISVLAAHDLQSTGNQSIRDYVSLLPGVNFNSLFGYSGEVNIRGVTTGRDLTATVGVYVDDVPLGGSSQYTLGATNIDLSTLDLNHIEVLRGPQGTLYGSAAMGGVLKYVTNAPATDRFSGSAEAQYSNTQHGGSNWVYSGVLNLPISEGLAALRIAGSTVHNSGYIDATGPAGGQHINGTREQGGRVTLLVTPNSELTIKLTASAQTTDADGRDAIDYDFMTGKPLVADLTRRDLQYQEPSTVKVNIYSGFVEYDFGWARLSSTTSYQGYRLDNTGDYSLVYPPFLNNSISKVLSTETEPSAKRNEEIRLLSPTGGRLEWLVGLFDTHENGDISQLIASTLPSGLPGPNLYGPGYGYSASFKELAGYGDVTWNVTPDLAVTGGMRFAHNSQDFLQINNGLFTTNENGAGSSSESFKTYLFSTRYRLSPDNDVYVRAANGYRPGGPNVIATNPLTGVPIPSTASYKSDSLWSYEGGYKGVLLDRTLSIQAAAYYIKWKDIQQALSIEGAPPVISNGSSARIRGLELALAYRPTDRWDLSASLSVNDARLTADAAGLQGKDGDRLPNSAKTSGVVAAKYLFDLGSMPAFASVTERYVGARDSSYPGSVFNPNFVLPAYYLTDLRAGMTVKNFDLSVFARNLTNRRGLLNAYTAEYAVGGPFLINVERPRTIGLDAVAHF